jgi:hypothetical protein
MFSINIFTNTQEVFVDAAVLLRRAAIHNHLEVGGVAFGRWQAELEHAV